MVKKSFVFSIVGLSLIAAACGGGGGNNPTPAAGGTSAATSQPAAPCSPSGTSLTLAAKNVQYDKACLAAPANTAFTIKFSNNDSGIPHNVDIMSSSKSLFAGKIVKGPTSVTYNVPSLPAGSYQFHCDIHPSEMNGTFVVS
jgi:plastocyanin